MDTTPKEAYLYQSPEGRCPFEDWVVSLRDRAGVAKIRARIARARTGNLGQWGAVGQGVCEMKIDFGPGYRVYFGEIGSTIIILLCGGDKSTQKNDIAVAQRYWTDYRRRHYEARKTLS